MISLCSQIDLRRQQKILLKDVQYLCILSKFEGVVCAPCLENHSGSSQFFGHGANIHQGRGAEKPNMESTHIITSYKFVGTGFRVGN